jgi:hypothetical protein
MCVGTGGESDAQIDAQPIMHNSAYKRELRPISAGSHDFGATQTQLQQRTTHSQIISTRLALDRVQLARRINCADGGLHLNEAALA